MKISLELILEILYSQCSDWEKGIQVSPMKDAESASKCLFEKCGLFSVRAAQSSNKQISPNTLWFCRAEELASVQPELMKGSSFLLYGDQDAYRQIADKPCCNLLMLPDQVDAAEAYNLISNFFSRLNRWRADMEMVLANNGSIQNLVDTAQGILSHPIIIWNPSFEYLACLNCEDVGDRMPISDMVKNGSFSGKTIKRIIEMGYLNNVNQYDRISLVYPPNWANCPFAIRVFSHQNRNVATMAQYYFDSPPTLGQLELLGQLEKYLCRYTTQIPRNAVETNKRLYEPFLIDLLENRLRLEPDIHDRLQFVRLPFESSFLLLEIKLAYFSAPLITYVTNNCKALFAHSKVINHAESIFVLIYRGGQDSHAKLLRPNQIDDLRKMMETVNGICGFSQPFETLLQLHDARLECSAVLRASAFLQNGQQILHFSEYTFYCLLEMCQASGTMSLKNLITKPVRRLYAAAKETGNDNTELLDYYLNHNCNITDTARKMNLHRNSVIYRLEKINDHLGGALDDAEQKFQITAMLKLLRLPSIKKQLDEELFQSEKQTEKKKQQSEPV